MSDDDLLEDQKMEVEALESIYPDELKVMSEDPFRLSIDILEEEDGEQVGIRMIIDLPAEYPNVPPEVETSALRKVNRDQLAACTEHVRGLIEENLGMPMVFTLASAAQEWVQENVVGQPDLDEQHQRGKQQFETFSDQVIYDVTEAAASRGTPVTAESFAAWKVAFDAEMGVKEKAIVVTGRQLFESGAVKSTDDGVADLEPGPEPTRVEEAAAGEGDLKGVDLDAWQDEIDLDDLDDLPSDEDDE